MAREEEGEATYLELVAAIKTGSHADICCAKDEEVQLTLTEWLNAFGLDATLKLAALTCACPNPSGAAPNP